MSRTGNQRIDYKEKQNWMVQYNSTAIFNKKIKTIQNPDWKYQSFNEIDEKFNDFCSEYEQKFVEDLNYQKRRTGKYEVGRGSQLFQSPKHKKSYVKKKYEKQFQQLQQQFQTIYEQEYESHQISQQSGQRKASTVIRSRNNSKLQPSKMRNEIRRLSKISNNSVDSMRSEKIKEVTQRLTNRSNEKSKPTKQGVKFTEEEMEEEKIVTKSFYWQKRHDKIKEHFKKEEQDVSSNKQDGIITIESPTKDFQMDAQKSAADVLGTHSITVLFQALLINKLKDCFGYTINIDSGIPVSEKVMQMFGINKQFLKSIKSEQDRRKYITMTMDSRIDMMMKDWESDIQQKDKKLEKEQKIRQEKQEKVSEEEKDQFDWLTINTRFTSLKKKFKALVIQKMNEYENQIKLVDKYNQQQRIQSKKQQKQIGKVNLYGLKNIQTKEIIKSLSKNEGDLLHRLELNKHRNVEMALQQKEEDNGDHFIWDNNLEDQFQQNKKNAKQLYYDDIITSDWSELAYLPLVQNHNLANKKQMKREFILDKYQEGEILAPFEHKFVSDTSKLLNQCLDKPFLEKSIKNTNKESLQLLELNLAEDIISNYQNLRSKIKNARTKFILDKAKKQQQKNKENVQKWNKQQKQMESRKQFYKSSKLIAGELERMEYKNPVTFVYQHNFFFKIFVNIIRHKLKQMRLKKQLEMEEMKQNGKQVMHIQNLEKQLEYDQREKIKMQQQAMSKLSRQAFFREINEPIKSKIHKLHPPSKLEYYPKSEFEETPEQEALRLKDRKYYMGTKIQEFKLGVRSDQPIRQKQNFISYYSSGPIPPKPSYIPKNDDYQPISKDDQQKVEKIVRKFKQYKNQINLKNVKASYYNQQYKVHLQKLNDFNKAKYLTHAIAQFIHHERQNKINSEHKNLNKTTESKEFNTIQSNDSLANPNRYYLQQNQTTKNKTYTSISLSTHERLNTEPETIQEQQGTQKSRISKRPYITINTQESETQQLQTVSQLYFTPKSKKDRRPPTSRGVSKILDNTQQTISPLFGTASTKASGFSKPPGFLMSQLKLKHSTLLNAAKRKQFQTIKYGKFEYNTTDLRQFDPDGCQALYYTVQNQDVEFTQWLVQQGADPNQRAKNDFTPLHIAFQKDNLELIMTLLEHGGDLNVLSKEGFTPPGMGKQQTLKLLNLEEAIIVSSSGNMFGCQGQSFNNNKLLKMSVNNQTQVDRLKLDKFYPLGKVNQETGRKEKEQPTVEMNQLTSL